MLSMDANFACTVKHEENMPLHEISGIIGNYAIVAIAAETKIINFRGHVTCVRARSRFSAAIDVAVVVFAGRFGAFNYKLVKITS